MISDLLTIECCCRNNDDDDVADNPNGDTDGADVTAARASLEACLELDDVCLHRHNKHLAEVHDALARCHVMLGTSCFTVLHSLCASWS